MKINELKSRIKAMSKALLDDNFNQEDSVKALKEEFKEVQTKDLVNIYKETKEEWCKTCAELTKEDKKVIKTKNKAQIEKKKKGNVITPKEVKKPLEKAKKSLEDMFKVVSKETILEGELGAYTVTKNGVQAGNEYFKDLDSVEEYIEKELESFYKRIDEIKAAFAYM